MTLRFAALAAALIAMSAPAMAEADGPPDCDTHLVSIDQTGTATAGSKAALLEAIRTGKPIRIGFRLDETGTGSYYLTHWYEPQYLTVMGDEVYTHASKVHLQVPDMEIADIPPAEDTELWLALIGTDGEAYFRFTRDAQPLSRQVASWWCTLGE